MSLIEILLVLILLGLLGIGCLVSYVALTTERKPVILRLEGEDSFLSPDSRKSIVTPVRFFYFGLFLHLETSHQFPSIEDPVPEVDLSLVVPAYNEESRLPLMLKESIHYLESRSNFSYEIIVVDDGSGDATAEVALSLGSSLTSSKFRVLKLKKNRGKGGAVRLGVLRARGKRVLFADADGATKFSDLLKLEEAMSSLGAHLVCGSRAHLEKDSIASRSTFRTILMKGFHLCVWFFGARSVKDTQCGFKLMNRESAKLLFQNLHIERWAFDVELIKIAEILGLKVAEVSVHWQEVDGSKLDPLAASFEMLRDLSFLWLRYGLGLWAVKASHKKTE